MIHKLSDKLQRIYELELELGNTVINVNNTSQDVLPLSVIFKNSIHKSKIEATILITPPIVWYTVGQWSGYVCQTTRQSVYGPIVNVAEAIQDTKHRLSDNLKIIYDLEIRLGNTVIRIDEPAGSLCPLAVIFAKPLHKTVIDTTLLLSSTVKWWENYDPHYPVEGGYICGTTGHVVAGPVG